MPELVIAAATADDLDAIEEISRHSFRRPWPRQTFVDELTRPHGRLAVARDLFSGRAVASPPPVGVTPPPGPPTETRAVVGAVVGYLNHWLVADEVHLLAIAAHPDARRRGVATALMQHLIDAALAHDARVVTLEVRASNVPAIALYQRFGFTTAAVRRGYYGADGEDAVVMLRERP